mgnify:CR=1 FL=1
MPSSHSAIVVSLALQPDQTILKDYQQEYIDSLNGDEEWIIYNSSTNTAEITSLEAFVKHCKSPTKDVGAFDDLGKERWENSFGFGKSRG